MKHIEERASGSAVYVLGEAWPERRPAVYLNGLLVPHAVLVRPATVTRWDGVVLDEVTRISKVLPDGFEFTREIGEAVLVETDDRWAQPPQLLTDVPGWMVACERQEPPPERPVKPVPPKSDVIAEGDTRRPKP